MALLLPMWNASTMGKTILHFIWEHTCFYNHELCSQHGAPITIVEPGIYNPETGPDFLHAKILIGNTMWYGGVVLHVDGSHWYERGLDADPEFGNTILHVAYRNIDPAYNGSGGLVPTLELNGKIPEDLIQWQAGDDMEQASVYCAGYELDITAFTENYDDQLVANRLEESTDDLHLLLTSYEEDWDKVFVHTLLDKLGASKAKSGEMPLSMSVDLRQIMDHRENRFVVEALLLGQAGLLRQDHSNTYHRRLYTTYRRFCPLQKLPDTRQNIPADPLLAETLSYIAALVSSERSIFSDLIDGNFPLRKLQQVKAAPHWVSIAKATAGKARAKSANRAKTIISECITPLLYVFGVESSVPELTILAIEWWRKSNPGLSGMNGLWAMLNISPERPGEIAGLDAAISTFSFKKAWSKPVAKANPLRNDAQQPAADLKMLLN